MSCQMLSKGHHSTKIEIEIPALADEDDVICNSSERDGVKLTLNRDYFVKHRIPKFFLNEN